MNSRISALVNFVNVLFILYKWQENENHHLTYLRVPLPLCHFLCPLHFLCPPPWDECSSARCVCRVCSVKHSRWAATLDGQGDWRIIIIKRKWKGREPKEMVNISAEIPDYSLALCKPVPGSSFPRTSQSREACSGAEHLSLAAPRGHMPSHVLGS